MMTLGKKENKANWPCMGLGKITSPADIKRVRQWLSLNAEDDYVVKVMKETRGTRRYNIATFVRMKSEVDAIMFKLAWCDYE